MQKLILATRSSPLALWQANEVTRMLENAGFTTELKAIETIGDKKLNVTLSKIGDKGVFTKELEQMLIDGEAHLAVHSAKDMPSSLPDNLEIVAFTEREVPCDVLVSHKADFKLENRPVVIGTSSTRRIATLKRYFPEVQTVPVRGNLQTRIRKMEEGQCDALLLAYAGVHRMGYSNLIREQLDLSVFTPAVGQGSLAIEVSSELPNELKTRIRSCLEHLPTAICLEAERAFLRKMDGGCSVPVFGFARFENEKLIMSGGIVSLDGQEEVRKEFTISNPDRITAKQAGTDLANQILSSNGNSILQKIKQALHS
ncbi:MAG TPA: hydroxymethylbilane synthase [Catalimonadaceae bacterium]|nr:hydroxymethylbilane synthase [Catalimonadaceae bacterium]